MSHGSKWPDGLLFSQYKRAGAAVAIAAATREKDDAAVEYRLSRLKGRFAGDIKEKASHGKG